MSLIHPGAFFFAFAATQFGFRFTGVDVFFVISGYLITNILRRDIEAGRFSLLAFYDRRSGASCQRC